MSGNSEQLKAMISVAVNTKYKDVPPTEEQFKEEARNLRSCMVSMYPVSDEEFEEILRSLMASLLIIMDKGTYIYDKDKPHQSWLPSRRADIEFHFWARYKAYLAGKMWNTRVISSLDEISDKILDLLGDPQSKEPFQRRRLILGDVQSGKTANFTALCNKASDAGYRVIIVLTGTMENLRQQTQERLDAEFSGRSSRYLLDAKADQAMKDSRVGVGRVVIPRRVVHFTSVVKDFDVNVLRSNDLSLHSVNPSDPILLVIKKNKKIIENLITWLKDNNIHHTGEKIELPLLMIDDEADSASVNVNPGDDSPTAINGAIRKLLYLFSRASYVGVTATPFANIFIDPDKEEDMFGEDLFPRDFIYALTPPSHYIGADRIFGEGRNADEFLVPLDKEEMDNYGSTPILVDTSLER